MKLTLTFEVEVDEEALARYGARWTGFSEERPAETLIREAVAAWETEELITGDIVANGETVA